MVWSHGLGQTQCWSLRQKSPKYFRQAYCATARELLGGLTINSNVLDKFVSYVGKMQSWGSRSKPLSNLSFDIKGFIHIKRESIHYLAMHSRKSRWHQIFIGVLTEPCAGQFVYEIFSQHDENERGCSE